MVSAQSKNCRASSPDAYGCRLTGVVRWKLYGVIYEVHMHNYHTWLLDLDDTLQIGPLSWASIHLFPDLIAQTGIKPDKVTFEAAYERAEEIYRAGGSNDVLGDEFFRMIGWSPDLKPQMMERFKRDYQPA